MKSDKTFYQNGLLHEYNRVSAAAGEAKGGSAATNEFGRRTERMWSPKHSGRDPAGGPATP